MSTENKKIPFLDIKHVFDIKKETLSRQKVLKRTLNGK